MGMSASQGRLLTLTARLTQNEYSSQRVAAVKMKLSRLTDDAAQEYMAALNKEDYSFLCYNSDGGVRREAFTPNVVYNYLPQKNQYAIKNSANQILVPRKDAQNFEKSATLYEFLNCYDCVTSYSQEVPAGGGTPVRELSQLREITPVAEITPEEEINSVRELAPQREVSGPQTATFDTQMLIRF